MLHRHAAVMVEMIRMVSEMCLSLRAFGNQVSTILFDVLSDRSRQLLRGRVNEAGLLTFGFADQVGEHGLSGGLVGAERHPFHDTISIVIPRVPLPQSANRFLARFGIGSHVRGAEKVRHV